MIRVCACGKDYVTYLSRMADGRGKFCSKACANESFKGKHFSPNSEFKKGQKPHNYKGWRMTQARKPGHPYKQIYMPEHPYASSMGYVREHRLVMEKQLGRNLRPDEVVDHINMDTLDNRPENLRVMLKTEHDRMNTKLNVHRRWQTKNP